MLSQSDLLRTRLQDPLRLEIRELFSDGRSTLISLPHSNIQSGSAFVASGSTWSGTGATFNPSGFVRLDSGLPQGSALRVEYFHSVFSDAELGSWLSAYGFLGATREAIWALMFDGLKRSRWSSPDGTSYDDTAALAHLQRMSDRINEELADDAVGAGGFGSWSEGQAAWGEGHAIPPTLW